MGKNRLEKSRNRLSRRAFVLSLDILIAVFVTLLVLTAAHMQIMNSEFRQLSHASLTAAGSDIVEMLSYSGALQTLDSNMIESEMKDLLPLNYEMMLKIVVVDGTTIYAGDSFPEEQFVATGIRYFAVPGSGSFRYAYVSYKIWTK
ncbi:hypothetical protein ACFL96_17070 [Thermoproteota archaeon]